MVPPWLVTKILTGMAKLLPRLKLVPQKDLAELAFREENKRKLVRFFPLKSCLFENEHTREGEENLGLCILWLWFFWPHLRFILCVIRIRWLISRFYGWLSLQTVYNIVSYKHKPRLGTALELLRTTKEIEEQLEKVCWLMIWSVT